MSNDDNDDDQTTQEIKHMFDALQKGKIELEKQFKKIFDDYLDNVWNSFYETLETHEYYNCEAWIRRRVDNILESLLSGRKGWLESSAIISTYSWNNLREIRLAILKAHGNEIENVVITDQAKRIEELQKTIKILEHRNYADY